MHSLTSLAGSGAPLHPARRGHDALELLARCSACALITSVTPSLLVGQPNTLSPSFPLI